MSVGIGIEIGASVVKVATADAATTTRAQTFPRRVAFPELVSRIGTRVPHVCRDGNDVVIRHTQDLFVEEVRQAIRRLTDTDPIDRAVFTLIAPDWWTPRACAAVREALAASEMDKTRLVSSGVAAVQGHRATVRSMPATVAVLDLGAYTCSAAIITDCGTDEIRRVGHPAVVHGRGGADLDARILHHVLDGLRGQGLAYRRDDAEAVEAAHKLLAECRAAKEALSASPVTTLSTSMPGAASQFRLVRAEHDEIARPAVQEIVHVLKDCIAASGHDVGAVLLTGGGAPIPTVTQQISVELGIPVRLDENPSTVAARGAALESFGVLQSRSLSGKFARRRARRNNSDGRHRGTHAGVATAYVAFALVATGGPVSSAGGSADSAVELAPASSSQTFETPVIPISDVLPWLPPSVFEPEPAFRTGDQLVPTFGVEPPATTKATATATNLKSKEGGSSDTTRRPADPTPAEPAPTEPAPAEPRPAEPAPADPSPAEPIPADSTPSDPTPGDGTSGGGEPGGDVQP